MLTQLDRLPPGFLEVSATELHRILPGPTLIHLGGLRVPALFVSVLLHGNETTGWLAVQTLLQRYRDRPLPRALSLFIGNIAAARAGVRRFDHEPDYNRIWPGTALDECAHTSMARRVVEEMAARGVFASVDVHNNTGINPHYGCTNRLDPQFLQLATLFSRLVVYFTHPRGVQSAAFAPLCPAVTLECGKPGDAHGIEHVTDFLEACLHLSRLPDHPVAAHDIDLFHTVAQIHIPEPVDFDFAEQARDLHLDPEIERMNFTELPAGTVWGTVCLDGERVPVQARNGDGLDVTAEYFGREGEWLVLKKPAMPSMLTLDIRIIRQDCLCYLMERCPT